MMTSIVASDSLLAVDIGTTTTRAQLFDVIDGRYRFVAVGSADTTWGPPFSDAAEGVRMAIGQLAQLTGRIFLNTSGNLITPSALDNTGVDAFVLTISAGPPIKVVAVGLVNDVSVESVKNLAATTYTNVVDTISLNEPRSQAARIDKILKARPDLVMMAGGIEGGASRSVRRLVEAVGLASYLLPKAYQPQILFAGNQQMTGEVETSLRKVGGLHIAPNVRPTWEVEQLAPAQKTLVEVFRRVRTRQSAGIKDLDGWARGRTMPTSAGFERIIRFLSKIYDPGKGVLGVDVGASSTTIVSAFNGTSSLRVFPQLGLGFHAPNILRFSNLDQICRWLITDVPGGDVRDYLYNKAAFPESLPVTAEEMAIEHAITRQAIRIAVKQASKGFPSNVRQSSPKVLPWFEPCLATGSVFTKTASPGQSMMMLLDGLQPAGVTTFLLDQNNLISSLGAASEVNPILAVQVLGSNTVMNLGTVIAPVGSAKIGTSILRVKVAYEDGREHSVEVKFGSMGKIPLPNGETATLRLQPLHRFDVGMGPGRGGRLQVVGGSLGIVVDARGRPLTFSRDPAQQRAIMQKWLQNLEN